MKRQFLLFIAVSAALTFVSCKHTPPANVAAEVNGRPIKNEELEKIYQSQYPQTVERSNEDQVMSNKLEVLNSLITNEIMMQRAEKLGLTAVDADVEAEFNKMKSPYTKEDFDKQLAAKHGKGQPRVTKAGGSAAARNVLPARENAGRLSHRESHHPRTRRPTGSERPPRAAEYPRDVAESQRPVAEIRLLRSGTEQRE